MKKNQLPDEAYISVLAKFTALGLDVGQIYNVCKSIDHVYYLYSAGEPVTHERWLLKTLLPLPVQIPQYHEFFNLKTYRFNAFARRFIRDFENMDESLAYN